ncbi:hypothetical protein HBB16_14580 [Pseudonocardia sp. MCCB 268]|nr:hypothetical protein [Pseudonocardia cytotoxica]
MGLLIPPRCCGAAAQGDRRCAGGRAAAWLPSLLPGTRWRSTGCTMADGIAVGRPGDITFPQVAGLIDELVTSRRVNARLSALVHCLERAKLVVEPAGAAPVAALLEQPGRSEGPGGRQAPAATDPLVLLHVIRHWSRRRAT